MSMRNIGLKPREEGTLPASKFVDILRRIYPEETVQDILKANGYLPENEKEGDSHG